MERNPSSSNVTVVGGVPQPAGGVTGYIYRMSHHLDDRIGCVIDLYPSAEKWSLDGPDLIARKSGILGLVIWVIRAVWALVCARKIYFNFSNSRFFTLAALLPKLPWQTWIITLHHGELQSDAGLSGLQRFGLRRMDRIGHIGSKQRAFYIRNNFPGENLFPIVPFLPFVAPPKAFSRVDENLLTSLAGIRKLHEKIILTSGYPSKIYNHEWVIEYMSQPARDDGRTGFICCLYGSDPENRWDGLKSEIAKTPNAYLMEHLQPDAFQQVLATADIYLRPNSVDSYGVAVGEAVSMGKIAIASDACDRFDGALLFPVGDKNAFFKLINDALDGKSTGHSSIAADPIELCRRLLD